jgi:hypothetical protein
MRPLAHPSHASAVLAAGLGDDPGRQSSPSGPAGGPSPQRGAGAGYLMVGSILLGVGLGWLLDHHYGTSPRWTVALSMLFLGVGIYQTIREANR